MRYAILALMVLVSGPSRASAQSLFSQGRLAMAENSGEWKPRFTALQVLSFSRWEMVGLATISEPFWVAELNSGVPVKVNKVVAVTPGLTMIYDKFDAFMVGPNLGIYFSFGRGGNLSIPVARHLRDVRQDAFQWAVVAEYSIGDLRLSAQSFGPDWEALIGYSFVKPTVLYLLRNAGGYGLELRANIDIGRH